MNTYRLFIAFVFIGISTSCSHNSFSVTGDPQTDAETYAYVLYCDLQNIEDAQDKKCASLYLENEGSCDVADAISMGAKKIVNLTSSIGKLIGVDQNELKKIQNSKAELEYKKQESPETIRGLSLLQNSSNFRNECEAYYKGNTSLEEYNMMDGPYFDFEKLSILSRGAALYADDAVRNGRIKVEDAEILIHNIFHPEDALDSFYESYTKEENEDYENWKRK
ncbi:MAG: hypothetical protein MJZ02_06395 [Paludibacteraceae bacterium]|nr:hypothetical protein [Paludibacteraceae bacterium]